MSVNRNVTVPLGGGGALGGAAGCDWVDAVGSLDELDALVVSDMTRSLGDAAPEEDRIRGEICQRDPKSSLPRLCLEPALSVWSGQTY